MKATIEIRNLYSKPFKTRKYNISYLNVPVEKLLYYPDLDRMYITIAWRGDNGPMTSTYLVPENLYKVIMARCSTGRRVAFHANKQTGVMGHIFFGEESHLEIKRQIDEGERPAEWGNPNSPDWEKWKKIQKSLSHKDVNNSWWGFARVMKGATPELTIEADEDHTTRTND